jgi:hypothetical protein
MLELPLRTFASFRRASPMGLTLMTPAGLMTSGVVYERQINGTA